MGNQEKNSFAAREGLQKRFGDGHVWFRESQFPDRAATSGNPFRVAIPCSVITQGSRATRVNPGLELVDAAGVLLRNSSALLNHAVMSLLPKAEGLLNR